MSRIGKKIITIPEKTDIKISGGVILVKGPLGELSRPLHPMIKVEIKDKEVFVKPDKETIKTRALWGTYASHITNMISGVNKPFKKTLILEGIGFKSEVKPDPAMAGSNKIVLALGFSHPVEVPIPQGVEVTAEKNNITVSSSDKEAVGQFASRLRILKKAEPYKGKGMRYKDEIVRRKQGKKTI